MIEQADMAVGCFSLIGRDTHKLTKLFLGQGWVCS